MDTRDYMANNGRSYHSYGYLSREDSPVTPSDRGKAMSRKRMMGDRTGHRRVHHKTCESCGTAYQPESRECPWCGVKG